LVWNALKAKVDELQPDGMRIDARQALMCTNVKAARITIYAVLVNSGYSKVMKDASKPEYYYEITAGLTVTASTRSAPA